LPYGWQIFFAILTTLVLIVGYALSFRGFRTILLNFFTNIFHLARRETLLMHQLFFNKNHYLGMISRMSFETQAKTNLFIIVTKNKLETTLYLTRDFVKLHNSKLNSYSKQELRELLYDLRKAITDTSTSLSKEKFIYLYGQAIGNELWQLVYESVGGYKNYWEEKNLFVTKNIERLVVSDSRNNADSMWSILTQIDISIDIAILDMEETLSGLNGQIIKLISTQNGS
jgi:hypothetical protein